MGTSGGQMGLAHVCAHRAAAPAISAAQSKVDRGWLRAAGWRSGRGQDDVGEVSKPEREASLCAGPTVYTIWATA
jgi:hypothetical protein